MADSTIGKVVVVGDSPVALAIRAYTGALRSSERAKAPTRFHGVTALVVIAHDADFENSLQMKQSVRREGIAARAERTILDALIARVPHVIVVSSAMVHGARQSREVITDSDATREVADGFVGDIIYFEHCLQQALLNATQGAGGPELTFLRSAALVGPGIDTLITRHFEAPRLLSLREQSRQWQFVHVEDVARAVETVIAQRLTGTLTVGAVTVPQDDGASCVPDVLSVTQVCALARIRTIELSQTTAFAMAERLHQFGVLPAPPIDMEYAVYDWTVMPKRLLDAGWLPQYSSSQCVDVLMEQASGKLGVGGRRVGTRDAAALGAAGAAVAVLGTAAAWRQVRTGRK